MNIWLINHYGVPPRYYPLARPANFAKYLIQMGHTVKVIAASTVHNSAINLIDDSSPWKEVTEDGIDYVYIRCRDYQGNGTSRIFNMCQFAWKLPGVCKRFPKPDAIVATSVTPMACAMGLRLARKYHCRGVAEIADLWPESIVAYGVAGPRNPAVWALRRLERWIYRKADAVVFTMEGAYDYIVEQGWEKDIPRSKVRYINNGVDLEAFRENQERWKIRDEDLENPDIFKVVYTGAVRKVNNVGVLLDAAKNVSDPRAKFLIWGDGDERAALEQRVADEHITNVVFKGRVEKKYIPYIVSKADANFIHGDQTPLLRFGISPNKLFDYFAAEKPILIDMKAAYNPVERYSCGLISATPEELVENIEKIARISAEEYQKMCQGSKAAAQEYDFKNLTEKLVQTIEGRI